MSRRRRCWTLPLGAAPALVVAAHAYGQSLGGAPEAPFPWGRLVVALLLCLALAVGGAFAMRQRMGGGGLTLTSGSPPRDLELLQTLRISHQIDLCVLRFAGERLLVAASAQGVTIVARGSGPDEAPST